MGERTNTPHYRLFSKDDLSGFWALLADNLANMVIVAALCVAVVGMSPDLVFNRVLPGLGVALIFGLGSYAWLAVRLARREGRADVTALPYGISTPVLFIFMFGVILPVRLVTGDPLVAWRVGIAAAFVGGIIEALGSLIGPVLKRLTPRAGMLGTLAGIALVWIATVPMAEIYEHPLVGLPALGLILVGLVAGHRLPFGVPAGLAAIGVGTGIFAATQWVTQGAVIVDTSGIGVHPPVPVLGDLWVGLRYIAAHPAILLIVAPLEIYNFIETMNNVESAEAAGDRYDVRVCQALDGAGTLLGSTFGSPFPTTVYIGHPAYKRLGARSGYALGVGLVLSIGAWIGLIALLKSVIPVAAVAPLLVFVAIAICGQAYSAVPRSHLPAVALAMIPHVADLVVNRMQGAWASAAHYARHGWGALDSAANAIPPALAALPTAVGQRLDRLQGPDGGSALQPVLLQLKGIHLEGQLLLSRGAIVTGLLWGAIGALVIDGRYRAAAGFSLGAAALTALGFIHHSDLHLHLSGVAFGYVLWAGLCLIMHFTRRDAGPPPEPASGQEP